MSKRRDRILTTIKTKTGKKRKKMKWTKEDRIFIRNENSAVNTIGDNLCRIKNLLKGNKYATSVIKRQMSRSFGCTPTHARVRKLSSLANLHNCKSK